MLETCLAVLEERDSEVAVFNYLDCRLESLQAQLKTDDFLTELSVEGAILLFVLSLSEDSLNNDVKIFVSNI